MARTDKDFIERCSCDFGYKDLGAREKGEQKQALYKEIKEILVGYYKGSADMIGYFIGDSAEKKCWYYSGIKYDKYGLSGMEANEALFALYCDYPIFYFADTSNVGGDFNVSIITPLVDYEFNRGDFRTFYSEKIREEIEGTAIKVASKGNCREKAKAIYDYISRNTSYNYNKGNDKWTNYVDIPSHSVLGYVRNKSAVCEGFASTYQIFMNYLSIPALSISGIMYDDVEMTKEKGLHKRNIVYLPDEQNWIMVDVTIGVCGGEDLGFDITKDSMKFAPLPDDRRKALSHIYEPRYKAIWGNFL